MTLDGVVDILDVAGFLNAGKFDSGAATRWSEGDFNYDGVLDVLDVAEFMTTGAYDAGPYTAAAAPVAPVPEPRGLAAVALAAAAWWAARRRRAGDAGLHSTPGAQPHRSRDWAS